MTTRARQTSPVSAGSLALTIPVGGLFGARARAHGDEACSRVSPHSPWLAPDAVHPPRYRRGAVSSPSPAD